MGAFEIEEVTGDKKRHLDLLLLADEQEDMIDRYLERGCVFVLRAQGEVAAQCVVTDEGVSDGARVLELKNIATEPCWQRHGCGRALITFVERTFAPTFDVLRVGTGDSPLTIPFYESCGFTRAFSIPRFFLDHYDHPIFEGGVQLVDMVYLEKPLG